MNKVHWHIDTRLTQPVNVISSRCTRDAFVAVRSTAANRTASELGRTALPIRTEVQLAVTEAVAAWKHERLTRQLVNRLDGSLDAVHAVSNAVSNNIAAISTAAIFSATFDPPVGAIVDDIVRAVRNEIEPDP